MAFPYDTGGEDVSKMAPGDAVATLRSLPRRFRDLLGSVDDDRRSEVLAAASGVAAVIHGVDDALASVLVHDRAPVTLPDPGVTGTGGDDAIDRLEQVASSAASRVAAVAAGDGTRTGTVGGREVSAVELAQAEAWAGARRLRAVHRLGRDDS